MSDCPELRTERLRLRAWSAADRPAFAAMSRDRRVTDWLGTTRTARQSDALVDQIEAGFRMRGCGPWALEAVGVCPFIGYAGLNVPSFDAPFMPAVEAEWCLDPAYWGQGYATEAGRAAVRFAFEVVGLEKLVSFTAQSNIRSRRVMERLGMTHDPGEDFNHPHVPADSPLRRHVLYRIGRGAWEGLPNKRIEQTNHGPAGQVSAKRAGAAVCSSCAVRWAEAKRRVRSGRWPSDNVACSLMTGHVATLTG